MKDLIMTSWEMYGLVMLSDIVMTCGIFNGFLGITCIIFGIFGTCLKYCDDISQNGRVLGNKFIKSLRWLIPIFIVSLTITTLIPTTKQMAAIILVPKIINGIEQSEPLQEIPNNLLDLANDWINELKPSQDQPPIESSTND